MIVEQKQLLQIYTAMCWCSRIVQSNHVCFSVWSYFARSRMNDKCCGRWSSCDHCMNDKCCGRWSSCDHCMNDQCCGRWTSCDHCMNDRCCGSSSSSSSRSSCRTDRWVHFQQNAGIRLFVHTWIVHGIDDCYQLTLTFGGFSAQCLSKMFLKEFTVLLLTTSLGKAFQVVVISIG